MSKRCSGRAGRRGNSAYQHISSPAYQKHNIGFVTQQRCLKYKFYTCFYFTSNDRRKHSVDTIACIFTTLEGGTPQREVKRARGWHFALQKECVTREKRKIGKKFKKSASNSNEKKELAEMTNTAKHSPNRSFSSPSIQSSLWGKS